MKSLQHVFFCNQNDTNNNVPHKNLFRDFNERIPKGLKKGDLQQICPF